MAHAMRCEVDRETAAKGLRRALPVASPTRGFLSALGNSCQMEIIWSKLRRTFLQRRTCLGGKGLSLGRIRAQREAATKLDPSPRAATRQHEFLFGAGNLHLATL